MKVKKIFAGIISVIPLALVASCANSDISTTPSTPTTVVPTTASTTPSTTNPTVVPSTTPSTPSSTTSSTSTTTSTTIKEKRTVNFYTNGGSSVNSQIVDKGSKATKPTDPTKQSTAQFTYTFVGWYKDSAFKVPFDFNTAITTDTTLYAKWGETVNAYTVTWKNYDGTELENDVEVLYGTTPIYDGLTPTRDTDNALAYSYEFDKWSPDVTSVVGDATYTATFKQIFVDYTIKFVNDDDTVISSDSYHYGDQVTAPTNNPTKESTVDTVYTFAGWDSEITNVTGDKTYKATYTENTVDSNAISENTAYSFVVPAQTGDVVITGSYNGSSAVTQNKITLDAQNGKLVPNGGNENDHNSYQINTGTKLSFSTSQAVKVTVYMWGLNSVSNLYNIVAQGVNTSNSEATQTYTTSGAGTVTITATANDYIKRIEIELVDNSIKAEAIEVVYLKTAKSSNTTAGNGTYKTVNAKTVYKVGSSFDPSGIYGVVTYNNSTTEVVDSLTGLTFTGFDSSSAGKKTVTVSFTAGGETVSTTYDVYVINTSPSIVNNVLQVKVSPTYTGTIGDVVGGFNMFKTINQALDYLRNYELTYSSNYKLLYISAGTYNEKLWIDIPNLTIYGANKTNTIIEYNSLYYNSKYDSVANYKDASIDKDGFGHVTDSTQTVTIAEAATNCTIYDITISNYWNSYERFTTAFGTNSIEHRALALLIYADKVVLQDCRLLGYQDTLEAMTGRSYFYNSYISGATDFIFGTNPTMYFKNCEIHSIYNGSTDGGYINAFKGINKDPSDYVEYGVIYDGCTFTKDSEITSSNTSIARPWDYYSNVMVMNSTLDSHISKAAYTKDTTKNQRYVCWTNNGNTAAEPTTSTVHFYEYNNTGLGALTSAINGMTLLESTVANNYNNIATIFGDANGYASAWTPVIITDEPEPNTITLTTSKGYVEGAYVEFETNADSILAYYKKHSSSEYNKVDDELVRMSSGIGRADVIGLEAGSYDIKLVDSSNSDIFVETLELNVTEDDRSGYAHFGNTEGVGAYKNDGTLKDDAVKLYVTEENKNTITYNGATGISEILKSKSSVPLDIRIIGTIGAATWNQIEYDPDGTYRASKNMPIENVIGINNEALPKQELNEEAIISGGYNTLNETVYSKLNGLTNKIKYDSEKNEFDSYYNVLDISGANNVTVEGIGIDAKIFQWGIDFKSNCESIEVKNITFDDSPEDSCSFEGAKVEIAKNTTSSVSLDAFTSSNFWVHNCTFNEGKNYWDVSKEQDKHEGDGSTDIRYVKNITFAYNHYYKTHKTGLIGSGSSQMTANVTLHHNWYEICQSRMPYSREANIHMYNNYYDSSTGTTMQIYDGAYAFVENCYFKNDKETFKLSQSSGYPQPAIKSYNNVFNGSKKYTDITWVTHTDDRTLQVTNGNLINQSFDTDSEDFYYDSENHKSNVSRMDDAEDLPTILPTLAGAGVCGGNAISGSSTNNS